METHLAKRHNIEEKAIAAETPALLRARYFLYVPVVLGTDSAVQAFRKGDKEALAPDEWK